MIYVKVTQPNSSGGVIPCAKLSNIGGVALEAKIKRSGGNISPDAIFAYSGHELVIIGSTGQLGFYLCVGNSTIKYLMSNSFITDTNEHTISGTWDGASTVSIYIDGVLDNTLIDATIPTTWNVNNIYFGSDVVIGSGNWSGDVRDCRAWNAPRTAAQILSFLNYSFTGAEAGLASFYPCNEGSGTVIHDLGSGGYYLALNGNTWDNSNPYTPPSVSYSDSSNAIFPSLQGLAWPVEKTPIFSTAITVSKNLLDSRETYTQYPLYKIKLSFEFLTDDGTAAGDYQQLLGFVLARHGSFEDFLFNNVDDNYVSNQVLGVGDGVTTTFQMVRTYAGFVDAVRGLNGTPTVYLGGVQTTLFTVSDHGVITFNTAPILSTVITATFNFYYRVRFTADSNDFSQFVSKIWELKSLEMVTVKGS